jgi:molybdate transport system ATP-binding protein
MIAEPPPSHESLPLEADLTWTPPGSRLTIDVSLRLGTESGILFGASGAGKSSILRLIAGLERPTSGRVRLGGETLFDSSTGVNQPLRRRRIGLIFQDDLLFPHLDVAANLRFGLNRWDRPDAERRVAEVASLCGVGHLMSRRPETLSGGERQRVGLARALAPRPRLLLCDEPVSALDHAARDVLIDRIRTVQQVERIPLLYVTHSPSEAVALGSRLFRLDAGRVVDEGSPLDVLTRVSGVPLDGVSNRFSARVAFQGQAETTLQLENGPTLIVPALRRPVGSMAVVRVRSDDVLLARGPIIGLSARNVLAGTVERVITSGTEAEVLVRTGGILWMVSVVTSALAALGLCAGVGVDIIIKARSCHVAAEDDRAD